MAAPMKVSLGSLSSLQAVSEKAPNAPHLSSGAPRTSAATCWPVGLIPPAGERVPSPNQVAMWQQQALLATMQAMPPAAAMAALTYPPAVALQAMAQSSSTGASARTSRAIGVAGGGCLTTTPVSLSTTPAMPRPTPTSSGVLRAARDPERHVALLQLLESGSTEERCSLAQQLAGSVLTLSQDKCGCWVIQKALEVTPHHVQVGLALELRGRVVECVEHMHGNFVVQKLVEQLPAAMLGFVVEEVEGKVEELAQHIYGCRTVQRLFEHCSTEQLHGVLRRLLRCVERLAQDQFGNNVVRHLLEHGGREEIRYIIRAMAGNLMEHANHKSSSLVLEKCLQVAAHGEHAAGLEDERAILVRAVLTPCGGAGTTSPLEEIMLNRFGNYLVQRVIECSRGEEREILRQRLKVAEPQLRRCATGKHILAAARRELGQRHPQTCR